MTIVNVTPREKWTLHVVFDNGRGGLFDVSPYLDCEAFFPLRKESEFQSVRNGGYYVEWACGADLSADTLEAHLSPL